MKAIVSTKYGIPRAFKYTDIAKPAPKDDEVLVKVMAASVTYSNQIAVSNRFFLLHLAIGRKLVSPQGVPGTDMAGRVEAAGKNVKQFKPGDEVYGDMFGKNRGAYGEYLCCGENVIALKPANLSFEEAAAVPEAAIVALESLRDYGKIQKGQKVLIYSASGGIGTMAVQIAKYYGAEVTAVCSTRNLDMVKALGADHVIDYTKEDCMKNGQQYNLIFAVRKTRSVKDIKDALAAGGIYVSTGSPSPARMIQEMTAGRSFQKEGKQAAVMTTTVDQKDLVLIKELIETGKLKPVIDKVFPLSRTAEAFRYYGKGHARGKVVIKVS